MTAPPQRQVVLCNGAGRSLVRRRKGDKASLELTYASEGQVRLRLPDFIRSVGSLPSRVLDLLEIAAYIFAADRLTNRGEKDSVIYDSWSRTFCFGIKVRDAEFWNSPLTQDKLNKLLLFITGDREFKFHFMRGHATPPTHLFDSEQFITEPWKPHHVMLFSGGLDSLAGAVERLDTSDDIVCLVSHRSQHSTIKTQNALVAALKARFPDRVKHYYFSCGLMNGRAVSETQRTRTFLYGSIAFALASGLSQKQFSFYENGITSLNFARRQDAINARASRTTHPKTMQLLSDFLAHVANAPFEVDNVYRWKTKAEVLRVIDRYGQSDLIPSAVTCSKTNFADGSHSHCGGCFQCIDRRFSASAVGLSDYDPPSLYSLDFLSEGVNEPESRTALIDYARLGLEFEKESDDHFCDRHLTEIAEVIADTDVQEDVVSGLCDLVKRFGNQTGQALRNFHRSADVTQPVVPNSLLSIIDNRGETYLQPEQERFARRICGRLMEAIPTMFARRRPVDENDFNDKVHGLIKSESKDYQREFPTVSFALAKVIPDHEFAKHQVIIESKYLRAATRVSKITDELAADLTKYPKDSLIVFGLYDPDRAIRDDMAFTRDIESVRRCRVVILR
jgi:7-cyano-7-deazaguanine synthase in queuosine biosynthesis